METLVGKLSLDRLLSPQSLKITKSDVAAMVRFDKQIPALWKGFLDLKSPKPFRVPKSQIHLSDFESIVKDLEKEWTPDEVFDKLKNLTSDEAAAFLGALGVVLDTLRRALPPTVNFTIFGQEEEEPSAEEKAEFIWLCRFVHDIEWIFDLIYAGALTQSDVELFEALYPDTYDFMKLDLATLLIEKFADKKKVATRAWQTEQLATFLKTSELSPDQILALQAGFESQESPPQTNQIDIQTPGLTQAQSLEEQ